MSPLPCRRPAGGDHPGPPPPLPPGLAEIIDIREFVEGPRLIAASSNGGRDELREFAERIAYRLLGDAAAASETAAASLRIADRRRRAAAEHVAVARAAVRQVLRRARKHRPAGAHAVHRERLRRELQRWGEPERTILTLVHLAGYDPPRVARLLDCDEMIVRAVAAAWIPAGSPQVTLAHLDR
jgi:hypothetical protein